MNISLVSPASPTASPSEVAPPAGSTRVAEASQQFESILLRQFLGESMKPLLEQGPGAQVYGYLVTESLASSLSKAGGLGLSSILQAQLGGGE